MAIVLGIIALFSIARTAPAFYDPSSQRWLNRDPLGDLGGMAFLAPSLELDVDTGDASGISDVDFLDNWTSVNLNLSLAIGNNPVNIIDAEGLQNYCPLAGYRNREGDRSIREELGGDAMTAAQLGRIKEAAKSYAEYVKHMNYVKQGEEKINELEHKLKETKGPKAQKAIEEALEREKKILKGHLKEIAQKWPKGPPDPPPPVCP